MNPDWREHHLKIGELYREHGVKGFCKAFLYGGTDANLNEGGRYVLEPVSGAARAMTIEEIGVVGRYYLLKFDGIRSPEEGVAWRKAGLWIAKEDLSREEGEIYDYEWEGVRLLDAAKNEIGTIVRVGYVPLKQFVVDSSGKEFYVPYRTEWIVNFDRNTKTAVMDLPEGILDLD